MNDENTKICALTERSLLKTIGGDCHTAVGAYAKIDKDNITISKTALEAAQGADAILVLTEWKEFKELDWKRIYQVMRKPAWVFDSRICLDIKNLFDIGFKVWTLGTTYDCNLNK